MVYVILVESILLESEVLCLKISDIREIFSKGSVALTKTGIRILYTNKDGWITQSIESNKETLSDLIKNCKSVVIECVRGFAIKVSFL